MQIENLKFFYKTIEKLVKGIEKSIIKFTDGSEYTIYNHAIKPILNEDLAMKDIVFVCNENDRIKFCVVCGMALMDKDCPPFD
jgi:hypothetical protein